MSVKTELSADGQVYTIAISGRFDFNLHQEFRNAYEKVDPKAVHYQIDLKEADYIDSSALGMLLLLRERAGGDQSDIDVINCPPELRNVLTISNFHQLFKIHS